MRIVKMLAIIALGLFLILQGLYFLCEMASPAMHALIGILGLVSGALILISFSRHCCDSGKDQ